MTWEVGPREVMRCLCTDNITINIRYSHNTAMFIVDQGTSPVVAQRHRVHSHFCIILSNKKHPPDHKADVQNCRLGIYLHCRTQSLSHIRYREKALMAGVEAVFCAKICAVKLVLKIIVEV